MFRFLFLCALVVLSATQSTAQVRILFDCTKAETAGNADWVIDADLHDVYWHPYAQPGSGHGSDPQILPTPAQSTVTSSTAETYWEGSLSSWGIDCVNKGYEVETLPVTGTITYGDNTNAQDLSNYKVYVMDEPNIKFTTLEKNAILQFVQHGGGLFMISDHNISDRNNDGWDSPNIWNDFMGTVTPQNPFGIRFNLENFSSTSHNVASLPNDSILHGPLGSVSQLQFNGATSMTISPDSNSSVKGIIYLTNASAAGDSGVMFAHARFGKGKVAAISDSSPFDDGTGNPQCTLYSSYATGGGGNHRKLIMNATIWLAQSDSSTVNAVNEVSEDPYFEAYKINSSTLKVVTDLSGRQPLEIFDILGNKVIAKEITSTTTNVDIAQLAQGIYLVRVGNNTRKFIR